jgi:hypothetical protein
MEILPNLPTNMNICKDPHISAYYDQCGLILLNALLFASISQHFSPSQPTVSVCQTTHLRHTYLITPISGSFAQKLPSPDLENVRCTGECGVLDSLIHVATPYRLDSLGFKAQ